MSQQPPFQQTIIQTVNIRRNPGCLGGCAGIIGIVILIAVIGAAVGGSKTSATPKPTRVVTTPVVSVSSVPGIAFAATPGVTPTTLPNPTAIVVAPTSTPVLPLVVTVKEEAVNLRQAADVASAVVMLVPPGTDALVIGEDTTGPDGVTRYIHARVGDKEGYLRSDLVSAPHASTVVWAVVTPGTGAGFPTSAAGAPAASGAGTLSQCMFNSFGGGPSSNGPTSWYSSISRYRLTAGRVDVDTNLFWKDSNKPVATLIRAGVISCVRETNPTVYWVAVNAGNGDVLVSGEIPGAR